ncbi:hypothetical protein [Bradyrhizobium sp. LHD-71]|uniref:hypothetical protein n=1 Tax=Bradyrhizobium sp. LHD-71 TaxID=3072141 RepID=UPI0028100F2C|nr:hypothetical protein [Bradyrhizobium sp. LHD-71]MDQ8727514.1 hypothetical protein [Bradyrhizobium sp. LHD-71]
MASIDKIAERFMPRPGVVYTAAVFNKHGFDRADRYYPKIDVRRNRGRYATHVELCDSFARRNYNRSQAQQIAAIDATIANARGAASRKGFIFYQQPVRFELRGASYARATHGAAGVGDRKMRSSGDSRYTGLIVEAMGWNLPHLVREALLAFCSRLPPSSA